MSQPLLSVLIPSLNERSEMLEKLKSELHHQIGDRDVEVVHVSDDRQMSIGQKRMMLLTLAKGEYVTYVDDDDWIPENYIDRILIALEKKPDCCSMTGRITFSDGYSRPFIHSLRYDKWIDDHENKVYYRPPNHLNVVRKDLALKAGFPMINSGEDRVYSARLFPLLNKEEWIEGVLYEYKCKTTFEEAHRFQVKR